MIRKLLRLLALVVVAITIAYSWLGINNISRRSKEIDAGFSSFYNGIYGSKTYDSLSEQTKADLHHVHEDIVFVRRSMENLQDFVSIVFPVSFCLLLFVVIGIFTFRSKWWEIDDSRRQYNHMNNVVGLSFPVTGIPIAIGDYYGQTHSDQIVNSLTNEGGILFEITKFIVELTGLPIAPEKINSDKTDK